jgi:hypothetical protein
VFALRLSDVKLFGPATHQELDLGVARREVLEIPMAKRERFGRLHGLDERDRRGAREEIDERAGDVPLRDEGARCSVPSAAT